MATLDCLSVAVESISGQAKRRMGFRGTRTPVSTVFENLQDMSVEELVDEFGVNSTVRRAPSEVRLRRRKKRIRECYGEHRRQRLDEYANTGRQEPIQHQMH